MHLAAFKGNFICIKYLIAEGADPQLRSKQSLTMTHMAAQGDSPYAFFLRELYPRPLGLEPTEDALDATVRDRNMCTPLHWAVYVSAPVAVSYLLSKPEVDINC